jgi:hypothetical protein
LTDAQPAPLNTVNEDEDGCLYHYTTLDTFLKIISSTTLRATHISYMNDTTEQQILFDAFAKKLKERDAKLFERLDREEVRKEPFFVTCFSEDRGDRLSQWRAYGGSAGVCLGFNKKKLQSLVQAWKTSDSENLLEKIKYVSADSDGNLDEIVDAFVGSEPSKITFVKLPNWTLPDKVFFASTLVKHIAFKEEKEWRIVTTVDIYKVGYFARGALLAPYVELKFDEEQFRDVLSSVTIGPSSHREQTTASVERLLKQNGVRKSEVRASKIPYRGF